MVTLLASGIIIFDFVTVYMLSVQFRFSLETPQACLAGCYVFCGLIVGILLVVYLRLPSDQPPVWGGTPASPWVWVVLRFGYPLFVLAYAITSQRKPRADSVEVSSARRLTIFIGLVILAIVLAVAVFPWVEHGSVGTPLIVDEGRTITTLGWLIGGMLLAVNAMCLLAVLYLLPRPAMIDSSLIIGLVTATLSIGLTLYSPVCFTVVDYVARGFEGISLVSLLPCLIYQMVGFQKRILANNRDLEKIAYLDELTGVANRRYLNQRLHMEWQRSRREGSPLAFLMIDVDFFKKYNDGYGHQVGDAVLRAVAGAIKGALQRPSDLAARYGGEEFSVVLPNTNMSGGNKIATAILENVRALNIPHQEGVDGQRVTVSIGVSVQTADDDYSMEKLVKMADMMTYAAKESGRDRYCSAVSDTSVM